MTLKKYLTLMLITTLISWSVWFYVAWMVNPYETNYIGFILFYSMLAISLIGTAAIVGFFIKFIVFKKQLAFRLVKEAFRQSFLFSLIIIISLVLLSKDLFSWTNIMFLVGAVSLIEFVLLGYEKPIKHNT